MRFSVVLIFVFSLTGLALGVKEPFHTALQEGKVVKIQPSTWGDKKRPTNKQSHPAVVLHNNGQTATLAQLTHSPIKGQKVIKTGSVAPSLDMPDPQGRKSHLVLNTPEIKNLHDPSIQPKNGRLMVTGTLPAHELQNIQQKRILASVAKAAAAKAKERDTRLGQKKRILASVAQAAAEKGKERNTRLGHSF